MEKGLFKKKEWETLDRINFSHSMSKVGYELHRIPPLPTLYRPIKQ